MYPNQSFTQEEKRAIADARQENPDDGQRTLARRLYNEYLNGPGKVLCRRSEQAIYSAIRRYDAKQAQQKATENLAGAGVNSTGVDDQYAPDPTVPGSGRSENPLPVNSGF